MKKRNILFSLVTAIAMMMLCPQGALAVVTYTIPVSGNKNVTLAANETIGIYDDEGSDEYESYYSNNCNGTLTLTAPEGYIIHVTGTSDTEEGYDYLIFDPDGVNKRYSGEVDVDYTFPNNTCVIKFTSDSYVSSKGLELEATAVPFLTNIAYTAEKQADGKYNVSFTFDNKHAETTYTVKEGTETVGTVANGATTLALTGVSEDAHNYTFTDGTNSVVIICKLGVNKMPTNGTSTVTLAANESIKIYDDGGVDNNYSKNCDGTIKLTAPKGYVIHVTGTCAAEDRYDYLIIDSDNKWDCGDDDGDPTDVDYTSQNNTCEIRFTSDDDYNYAGFALTATAVLYSPLVTLNSAGYATYSSAKDFVVATDGVKAYTATVSDDKITLTAVGDGEYVPAGTGVILYGDGKKLKFPTLLKVVLNRRNRCKIMVKK